MPGAALAERVASAHARRRVALDGNEAAAQVAYQLSEVIAIYPITPSSAMGEWADQWAAQRRPNLWGTVPTVVEMQSEAGAAGALHGALQSGALATTFTASQGLLLMIPNMYKIAGELTATVFHVAARSLATQALSIFGDHSDVMAARATGFAMLAAGSVQEAMDFALIAQAATLEARVPFLHFFDGFRTSHEIAKVEPLAPATLRAMIRDDLVRAHRTRALSPDHPVIRGTAQNPDVYFQARETVNPYYLACPTIVQGAMERLAGLVGRRYRLFDYTGAPDAERVIVIMGSGAETAQETVEHLVDRGEKVGLLRVRLYRPFSAEHFLAALPATVRTLAVLDRTKEPGSVGEPLYLDVVATVAEAAALGRAPLARMPRIIGGRYGLGSKEFTPAMVKGILDEMAKERPRTHFTVGIHDDVTHTSLAYDASFSTEDPATVRAIFFGLGSDGTVGANKNSIKIIGEGTDLFTQGYFVYDSKKSGAMTVSHLRFGPKPIHAPYLISRASFVACHQFQFLERYDVLADAEPGAVFLLNAPYPPEDVWDALPLEVQQQILDRKIWLFVIDAYRIAREAGLGSRINTIMQTCFFAIANVLPRDTAVEAIKQAIANTYTKGGQAVLDRNFAAVDAAVAHLHPVPVPKRLTGRPRPSTLVGDAPEFVRRVTAVMLEQHGDRLPVSAFPPDGTWPVGTAKWEKRNIAEEIPVWDEPICIQCNKCAAVCPHAAIRVQVYDEARLASAPATFKSMTYRGPDFAGRYTVQVAPEDCTGCGLCVHVCPAKDKAHPEHRALAMAPKTPILDAERENLRFFLALPEPDRTKVKPDVKSTQFLQPLFEYSGACAGCGETPYLKLLTQLFGDRAIIANATGCSSIYGGNLPTAPYTTNREGRGPAWANSLFEDNAEFGLGIRLAVDQHAARARRLLAGLAGQVGVELAAALAANHDRSESGMAAQRRRVAELKGRLDGIDGPEARELERLADYLAPKSVWIVGGDGWAYDIGYGGLDHVLASGANVNVLVLDTEVYSNTGGQQSKATPTGATAKFAAAGKGGGKKDLGLMAMAYGHVYVAQVALGAKDSQTLKALLEAEAYDGPSLVIAYSHCIAHGYDLADALDHQKCATDSGYWPLYRFDPRRADAGEAALVLDSPPPKLDVETLMSREARFQTTAKADPERYRQLVAAAEARIHRRLGLYQELARQHAAPGAARA